MQRQGDSDRATETERDRQTDRQTERQADRQTDRQTDRQRLRWSYLSSVLQCVRIKENTIHFLYTFTSQMQVLSLRRLTHRSAKPPTHPSINKSFSHLLRFSLTLNHTTVHHYFTEIQLYFAHESVIQSIIHSLCESDYSLLIYWDPSIHQSVN